MKRTVYGKGAGSLYGLACLALALVGLLLASPAAGGVTLSPGDIIVAEAGGFGGSGSIIRVDPVTGAQTIISSGGFLVDPDGVAIDAAGRIIVTDANAFGGPCTYGCGGIIRVDPVSGAQTVISSGGFFVNPIRVAIDGAGNIIVVDLGGVVWSGGIIRVDPVSGAQTLVSSGGLFVRPRGVTIDGAGNIIVTDYEAFGGPGGIIRVDPVSGAQTPISSGGFFINPSGVAIDGAGNIIVAEPTGGAAAVIRVNPLTGAQTLISSGGSFVHPLAVAIDAAGKIIVVDRITTGGPGTGIFGFILRVDPVTGAQTTISSGGLLMEPPGLAIVPQAQGDTWETKAPMPLATYGSAAGVINGRLYVVEGLDSGGATSLLQVYDPVTNTWTLKAPSPLRRGYAGAGVIGDKLYVVGGCLFGDCSFITNSLVVYDSITDTWETKASMPTARAGMAVGAIEGKLYAEGGAGSWHMAVYDPATNSWSTKAPNPTRVHGNGAAVIGDKLYIVGGCPFGDCNYTSNSLVVYDSITDTWETKAPMPTSRHSHAVGVVDGKIHVVGGWYRPPSGPWTLATTHEVYDPATDTWSTKAPMPTNRGYLVAAGIGSKFYAAAGMAGTQVLDVLEAYTPPNQRPTAEAGENQSIHTGQTVSLDGSGSFDDTTATLDLQYAWSFTSVPPGSTATLISADTANPTFVADLPGTYVVSLVVTDTGGLSSNPDEVNISSVNAPPNANAGPDQGTFVGDLVTLNGWLSNDPDFDSINFSWTLITRPAGSTATLSGADTAAPTFVPDLPGSYVAELIVSDPFVTSLPDQVTIVVITTEVFAEQQTVDAINTVGSLPPSSVSTKGNQTALGNFLIQVIAALQGGDVNEAKKKLQDAIERTDGCALRGTPDPPGGGQIKQDYIKTCEDQAPVYTLLKDALDALSGP